MNGNEWHADVADGGWQHPGNERTQAGELRHVSTPVLVLFSGANSVSELLWVSLGSFLIF